MITLTRLPGALLLAAPGRTSIVICDAAVPVALGPALRTLLAPRAQPAPREKAVGS